jgi:hypothetical protein
MEFIEDSVKSKFWKDKTDEKIKWRDDFFKEYP